MSSAIYMSACVHALMYQVRIYTEQYIRMCALKFFCVIILQAINQQRVENWTSDESSDTDIDRDDDKADQQESTPTLLPTTIHYLLVYILFWQALFKVSNQAVKSLLKFVKYFLLLIGKAYQCDSLLPDARPCTD